jgi:hypothetical protein
LLLGRYGAFLQGFQVIAELGHDFLGFLPHGTVGETIKQTMGLCGERRMMSMTVVMIVGSGRMSACGGGHDVFRIRERLELKERERLRRATGGKQSGQAT